jgi:hypothetical protein
MIRENIIEIAKSFIGMREIPGNMGFQDERFEQLMEDCGWQKGEAWCAYFVELVWKLAYNEYSEMISILDRLFSAGAIKTYNNFFQSGMFHINKHPEPGAIVIWQHWANNLPDWRGHAGIVISLTNDNQFMTIEGNTNSTGGREGIEVAEKIRRLNFDARNGLVLKGFIHPKIMES